MNELVRVLRNESAELRKEIDRLTRRFNRVVADIAAAEETLRLIEDVALAKLDGDK